MNPVPFLELTVGSTYTSTARTLTQADLSLSCMLTGDWHPIPVSYTHLTLPTNREV